MSQIPATDTNPLRRMRKIELLNQYYGIGVQPEPMAVTNGAPAPTVLNRISVEAQEQSKMMTETAESAKREVTALMQELQLNILHQTHLMQSEDKAKSGQILKQLQEKQQQLMTQLQKSQHDITPDQLSMLVQGMDVKDEQN